MDSGGFRSKEPVISRAELGPPVFQGADPFCYYENPIEPFVRDNSCPPCSETKTEASQSEICQSYRLDGNPVPLVSVLTSPPNILHENTDIFSSLPLNFKQNFGETSSRSVIQVPNLKFNTSTSEVEKQVYPIEQTVEKTATDKIFWRTSPCDQTRRPGEEADPGLAGDGSKSNPVPSNCGQGSSSASDSEQDYACSEKRKLDYSEAKLDLSISDRQPRPSFAFQKLLCFPSGPRLDASSPSMSQRQKNCHLKEKTSFTSLPEPTHISLKHKSFFNTVPSKSNMETQLNRRIKKSRASSPGKNLTEWDYFPLPRERQVDGRLSQTMIKSGQTGRSRTVEKAGVPNPGLTPSRRLKLHKYEIPSFYVFQPPSKSSRSNSTSSILSRVDDNAYSTTTEDDYDNVTGHRDRCTTRSVSKFTLPPKPGLIKQTKALTDATSETKTGAKEIGQGDHPWILILDGSEESSEAFEVGGEPQNQYDLIEPLPQETSHTDQHSNARSEVADHAKKTGHSEGKISRFFSRLRKSSSASSGDLKHAGSGFGSSPTESEGRAAQDLIVSHEDSQSMSKKSKMCEIL